MSRISELFEDIENQRTLLSQILLIHRPFRASLVHTCKICGLELPTELRLENHKKVHAKKSKVYEYGDPEFNAYRIQG